MATYSAVAITSILSLIVIGIGIFLQPPNLLFTTQELQEFNVMDLGAIGDGITDDSKAVRDTWIKACSSTTSRYTIFTFPAGNFSVGPVTLAGPCKTRMFVKVLGKVMAPKKSSWPSNIDTWIKFDKVPNLEISGNGFFDGQGNDWWMTSCKPKVKGCEKTNPTALAFHGCNGLALKGLTSKDSPRNHISINACDGATVTDINISAPEDSPNTDGIDISDSNNVHIDGGHIGTGDDCIAINAGSNNINITNLNCGPGHGISVGSLGRNGPDAHDVVSSISVLGANFTNTQNGVRIKTVAGGSGSASNITFSNIQMTNVEHPIILTQFYCPHCPEPPSDNETMVKISDVTFSDIRGTSATSDGINIKCSKYSNTCYGVTLAQINIQPANPSIHVLSTCNHDVKVTEPVIPQVKCAQVPSLIEMPSDHEFDKSQQAIATS